MRTKIITLILISIVSLNAFANEPTDGIVCDSEQTYQVSLPQNSFSPCAFTVSAWIQTSSPDVSQGVLDVGTPSQFFTFYIYKGFRMLVAQDHTNNKYAYAQAQAPAKNVWTHYCGSYDGKKIRIYQNGELVSETFAESKLSTSDYNGEILRIGAVAPDSDRPFNGMLNDIAIWNRTLSNDEVVVLYNDGVEALQEGLTAYWNASSKTTDVKLLKPTLGNPKFTAEQAKSQSLLNQKDSGYRGIWYYNQKIDNEYVYKYSGGMGTYPANHYPFSIYRPEVDKTFFCYGGFSPSENTLWHEVGVYDHKTKKVSRPTILVDKKTDDAHDNPVITIDDEGRVYVFSTSHGTDRPSYIHRSVRPYDISEFELIKPTKESGQTQVPMNNFSYFQVWNVPKRGLFALFTTYDRKLVADVDPQSKAQRLLAITSSKDGVDWSEWTPLAAIEMGHYQNARVHFSPNKKAEDGKPLVKIGTSFNYHPAVAKGARGTGLNWRTNLYYMESDDLGKSWHTVDGKQLETPLLSPDSPAMVRNYENENLNVYVTDLAYDAQDRPMIAYVTSKGFESGPEMGPRYATVARWLGDKWDFSTVTEVDNNYEYAMFYTEESEQGVIRLIGSFENGPQAYNTGGEISQWISRDNGKTWSKEIQLTENSAVNQCFPRRTIDANPDFYSFWAEGNGREKSISTLRFSTKDGRVYALPREMKEDWEEPTLIGKTH